MPRCCRDQHLSIHLVRVVTKVDSTHVHGRTIYAQDLGFHCLSIPILVSFAKQRANRNSEDVPVSNISIIHNLTQNQISQLLQPLKNTNRIFRHIPLINVLLDPHKHSFSIADV